MQGHTRKHQADQEAEEVSESVVQSLYCVFRRKGKAAQRGWLRIG